MNQFIQIVLYLGAIQGFLLTIFLFSLKANKIAFRILGLLTFSWGIIIGSFALQSHGVFYQYPHLLKLPALFLLLIFPLTYLQVKYLISNFKHFKRADLLHFIPFLFIIVLNLGFYIKSGQEKLFLVKNPTAYYEFIIFLQEEIIAVQGIVYLILSLILLNRYKRKIVNFQSNVDKQILKFEYVGIILCLVAWIIGFVGIHLDYLQIEVNVNLFNFVYLILVLIIYSTSFSAIRAPEIYKLDQDQVGLVFLDRKIKNPSISETSTPEVQYDEEVDKRDQFVDDPANNEINELLVRYIEETKPYLNPELSLQDLSDQIEVKKHILSRVINQKHSKNFFEFINEYRIEAVKMMMTDPSNKNFKLISIAYDAGFNSKASFNRIFKQMTSMTPTQFLETRQAG